MEAAAGFMPYAVLVQSTKNPASAGFFVCLVVAVLLSG
jgi:hypothetical protein